MALSPTEPLAPNSDASVQIPTKKKKIVLTFSGENANTPKAKAIHSGSRVSNLCKNVDFSCGISSFSPAERAERSPENRLKPLASSERVKKRKDSNRELNQFFIKIKPIEEEIEPHNARSKDQNQ